MDFLGNLIFSIVFTAIVYMAFPLIMLAINHGKFEKKRANKIALWNSVVLGVFFCFLTIALDSGSTWNAAPAIFYWWINGLILTDKNSSSKSKVTEVVSPIDQNISVVRAPQISNIDETPNQQGRYNVYGNDIAIQKDNLTTPDKIQFCRKCGKELSAESKFCQYCGVKVETPSVVAPAKNKVSKENISSENILAPNIIEKKKRFKLSHLIIGFAIIFGLAAGGLTIGFSVYYNGLYEELSAKMLEFDYYNYPYNSNNIDKLINQLPSNYKDVKEIQSQHKQIDKQITIIEDAERMNESDSEKVREAYVALYNFNLRNDNWDLSKYLDNVLENLFSKFVFGKEWENSDYYFQWYEDGEGDGERLWTNLPNEMDDNNDYYFYTAFSDGSSSLNPHQFGYENVNNSSEKFLAYRITNIRYTGSKWQIKIYCYSNSRTYTLN